MPFFLGTFADFVDHLYHQLTSLIALNSVYPSKMTAFGLKNDTENKLAKSRTFSLSEPILRATYT